MAPVHRTGPSARRSSAGAAGLSHVLRDDLGVRRAGVPDRPPDASRRMRRVRDVARRRDAPAASLDPRSRAGTSRRSEGRDGARRRPAAGRAVPATGRPSGDDRPRIRVRQRPGLPVPGARRDRAAQSSRRPPRLATSPLRPTSTRSSRTSCRPTRPRPRWRWWSTTYGIPDSQPIRWCWPLPDRRWQPTRHRGRRQPRHQRSRVRGRSQQEDGSIMWADHGPSSGTPDPGPRPEPGMPRGLGSTTGSTWCSTGRRITSCAATTSSGSTATGCSSRDTSGIRVPWNTTRTSRRSSR